jgi:hypothetical protein
MADDVPLVVSAGTSNHAHLDTRSITPLLPLPCVALICLAEAAPAAYCLNISCGQSVCVQGGPGSVGTVLAAVQVPLPLPLPLPLPIIRLSSTFTPAASLLTSSHVRAQQNTPSLLVRGSGKAADLIADAVVLKRVSEEPPQIREQGVLQELLVSLGSSDRSRSSTSRQGAHK